MNRFDDLACLEQPAVAQALREELAFLETASRRPPRIESLSRRQDALMRLLLARRPLPADAPWPVIMRLTTQEDDAPEDAHFEVTELDEWRTVAFVETANGRRRARWRTSGLYGGEPSPISESLEEPGRSVRLVGRNGRATAVTEELTPRPGVRITRRSSREWADSSFTRAVITIEFCDAPSRLVLTAAPRARGPGWRAKELVVEPAIDVEE